MYLKSLTLAQHTKVHGLILEFIKAQDIIERWLTAAENSERLHNPLNKLT
jgi:hypothetical protein